MWVPDFDIGSSKDSAKLHALDNAGQHLWHGYKLIADLDFRSEHIDEDDEPSGELERMVRHTLFNMIQDIERAGYSVEDLKKEFAQ